MELKGKQLTALALLLVLVACGGQTATSGRIMPLEEMPGGFEGPNVLEITGSSAVIQFTSGVPIVCNVAFGTGTNYGSLATMPMMAGAIRDHAVTLGGLAPNTTYRYRLTLTDEQARVYQSQDFTFTTSAVEQPPADRPEGENVASLAAGGRVIGVSSNFGGGDNDTAFGANNAIDGQPNTEWSSNGDGDDVWIEIELDQTYDVHTIGFWTRTMPNDTAQIFSFTVTTDEGTTHGPFDLPDASQIYYFPMQFTARTLRFDAVETDTGNTGAVEIEVFGAPHEE
ncbi:MAG: hypothetical protein CEE40_06690 [Chloroflexi bacterium B3_Chlor]|nr:MAG: hypothetical protein CEE40_06690 [Chloroflexi bacterium B3_Chlor]